MRTYDQLSAEQQQAARNQALDELLEAVISGAIRFNDEANHDDLQARIDRALERADEMRTPWFASSYLLDDERVREDLEGMARVDAEDAYYPEPHERVIVGIVREMTRG